MRTGIKKIILLIVLPFLLIGVGFGALLFYQGRPTPVYGKIITIPLIERPPRAVVASMLKQMAHLQTGHYELDLNVQTSSNNPVIFKAHAVFDGGLNPTLLGKLLIDSEITVQNSQYAVAAEVRAGKDKTFFRLNEVPDIPFVDLAKIQGRWYEFSNSRMNYANQPLLKELIHFFSQPDIFMDIIRLPDQTLDGERLYHYQALISRDDWPIIGQLSVKQPMQVELWIGKNSHYLQKATIFSNNNQQEINLSLLASNFNSLVSLDEPPEKSPLTIFSKDLFGQTNFLDLPLFGYLLSVETNDMLTDDDADGLYAIWERLFNADPAKADTDNDGYLDGEEVKSGYQPNGTGKLWEEY